MYQLTLIVLAYLSKYLLKHIILPQKLWDFFVTIREQRKILRKSFVYFQKLKDTSS